MSTVAGSGQYLVVGGYAVGHYGYVRPTGDLDVWIAVDPVNAHRVREALDKFGFGSVARSADQFLERDNIFRLGAPPVRIGLLTGISGVQFAECYQKRVETVHDGVPVDFISREDLMANKLAAGRHKDLDDLEHLEKLSPG